MREIQNTNKQETLTDRPNERTDGETIENIEKCYRLLKIYQRNTVEALVSGHSRGARKVSVTGAVRLRECQNTEFVWELNKMGFLLGDRK